MVLLIVAAAILGGLVVVALGRGGELVRFAPDLRPLDGEIMTAADVALLRPPAALWGYDMRATDEALNMVARTVTERDVEIATLRRQIADLQSAAEKPVIMGPPRPTDTRGSLPPAFRHGIASPRPPADAQRWSAWERPGSPPRPDAGPGENA